ncbi:MAG TPA: ImcF-related family protein [Bryobacteraceae bacterium]|nr:ImcF-related family protein [Bryobacteraceae bacterium]
MTILYVVLAVTLVALIVLLTVFLNHRKQEKKAAQAAGGGEQPLGEGADEISSLVRDADAKLAAARIQPGARVATLPVYLIMGDTGATKTCVMLHSGLDPELIAGQVYQGGNVAPTRTANFWFSRRAVFVEAGGRLPGEPAKWNKLVSRLAPKSSVVGKGEQAPRAAVVCYDIENFTKPGAMDLAAATARALRTRLGEISQSMGSQLPVYVLFTKADRLPFFTEFVRNLANEEAAQVLGVTLPMLENRNQGVYGEEETARLTGNFERLFRSLADARPEFLSRETDSSKLPAAYEFPREFRKLRPAVVQFLVDLCRPSQLAVGPFLRGFYFTGVRPIIINEAAPVQAAQPQPAGYGQVQGATGIFSVGSMAAAQAPPPPVATTRKVPQWLFLSRLFNDILLADRAAMGASGASTKTGFWRRLIFASAAGLCFLLTVFFTISFFNNRSLEAKVRDAAAGISSVGSAGSGLAPVESLRKLENLRQAMEALVRYRHEGAPLFYRWFLYVGNDLYPEARRVYFDRFKLLLFGQTQIAILANLRTLPVTPGPEYTPTYNALKAYLITTSFHEKSTKEFLTPVLMSWWMAGRSVETDRAQLAQKQFDFYADELRDSDPYTSESDIQAIAHARGYLSQFAGAERVYAFMLSEAGKTNPPIDFNRLFPGADRVVQEPHVVPGAFSKGGWAFMKDAMAHADRYFNGEAWVLGDQGSGNIDRAKLVQDIQTRYYAEFTSEWRTYIKSASVLRYASLKDASDKLKTLTGNTSPLLELIALASRNTDVDDALVKMNFQPVQTVVPSNTTDVVIVGPNLNYVQSLTALQTSIDQIANSPGIPSDAAAAPTLDNARMALNNARQIEQTFRPDLDGQVDKKVGSLLEDPITYAQGLLRALGPAELNQKGAGMCGQIGTLMRKYPFNPKGTDQATLADVSALYKPKDGAIWQFYDSALQKYITRSGSQFSANPSGGMNINPAFVSFLNRAAAFTDLAFPPGASDPQFKYTVSPLPNSPDVDKVTLIIDGQSAVFSPGTPGKTFTWPGPSEHSLQLKVQFKGGNQDFTISTYEGLWSVYRFIMEAEGHSGTQVEKRPVTGSQPMRGPSGQPVVVRLDFNPNPQNFFSGLGCVGEVARP